MLPIGLTEWPGGKLAPKPIAEYTVERMVDAGAETIYFVVSERKSALLEYFGDGTRFGVNIAYLYQEKDRQGTAQAVITAYPWIKGDAVLYGMPDTLVKPDDVFIKLLKHHKRLATNLSLGVFRVQDPSQYGVVHLDPADLNRVLLHENKPQYLTGPATIWGVACWDSAFTQLLYDHRIALGVLDIGDIFDIAINYYRVFGHVFEDGVYIDTGTADGIGKALDYVRI